MSGSVRVFSGNLWWGRADPDGLVEIIRRYGVEVFAAQELGPEAAEAIASELPFGRLEPDAVRAHQGMGIALCRPARYSQVPLHFRAARRVILDPSDWTGLSRPLDLVNVHFQAPHSLRPFPSFRVRRRQVEGLERFFAAEPSDARLVVGDYNATPGWPLYRRMVRGLSDAAVECARREGHPVASTWGPTRGGGRLFRIDHALVDGVQVENFRVVDIPGSDHSGLLFDCQPEPPSGSAD